jgi:hypothetical protein
MRDMEGSANQPSSPQMQQSVPMVRTGCMHRLFWHLKYVTRLLHMDSLRRTSAAGTRHAARWITVFADQIRCHSVYINFFKQYMQACLTHIQNNVVDSVGDEFGFRF